MTFHAGIPAGPPAVKIDCSVRVGALRVRDIDAKQMVVELFVKCVDRNPEVHGQWFPPGYKEIYLRETPGGKSLAALVEHQCGQRTHTKKRAAS
jgi:hypothetical protein